MLNHIGPTCSLQGCAVAIPIRYGQSWWGNTLKPYDLVSGSGHLDVFVRGIENATLLTFPWVTVCAQEGRGRDRRG